MQVSAHQPSVIIGYSSVSRDIMVGSNKLSFDDSDYRFHHHRQGSQSAPSWVLVLDETTSLDDNASIFHHLVRVTDHGIRDIGYFFFLPPPPLPFLLIVPVLWTMEDLPLNTGFFPSSSPLLLPEFVFEIPEAEC